MQRTDMSRRHFVGLGLATVATVVSGPVRAAIHNLPTRSIGLYNTHTGESLRTVYWEEGRYIPDALAEICHLLRDHRTDDIHPIEPGLLDLLTRLRHQMGSDESYQVISGYRSPRTNAMLAKKSGGVARKSLHMQGMAIDVRLPGRDLRRLRETAMALEAGGVGFYPNSDFVHLDLGRVRSW